MLDTTNILTSGQTSHGASRDPLEAALPFSSGILRDLMPLGGFVGLSDMLTDGQLKNVNSWKVDSQFTGSAAATPLAFVAPTATDPMVMRITSSTDASDILGNTQIQSSAGVTSAAFGRFFSRAGNVIHSLARFKVSSNGGATLIGLCNVGTGLMAVAGTIHANLTDGIFIHRAPASGTITFHIRRAGVSVTQVLTSTAVNAVWYEVGVRFDTTGVIVSFTDGATGVRTEFSLANTAGASPNAALAYTIIQGGNARTLDVQRMFAAQEAI